MDQQFILIIAALLTAFLGAVIGLVALSYRRLIQKYYLLKSREEELTQDSQAQAEQIIAEARARANEIVNYSSTFARQLSQDLQAELDRAKEIQGQAYQELLQTISTNSIQALNNISEDISSQLLAQTNSQLTKFQKSLLTSQSKLSKALEADYQSLQSKLKAYQEAREKALNEAIYQVISQVSSEVLGSSLTLKNHEDLVIAALDKAKKDNMFN